MSWTEERREWWRRRLDFVFFVAMALLVCGIGIACVALVNTTSVQMLLGLATLGPLVALAAALGVLLRRLDLGPPASRPASRWRQDAVEPPREGRRRAA